MMRYFNIAGPCHKAEHYMIDASTRLTGVEQLINMKQYFVIHAARLDLCLKYEGKKYPIELKNRRGTKYLKEGLEQTARYMDIHGCTEGWLAIFDQRKTIKWDNKIYMKKKKINGKTITIVGL